MGSRTKQEWRVEVRNSGGRPRVAVTDGWDDQRNWKMAIPWWDRRNIWFRSCYRLEYPWTEAQAARSVRWAKVAADWLNRRREYASQLTEDLREELADG
jgi:hypothetical protein